MEQGFEKLEVYSLSFQFTVSVYSIVKEFEKIQKDKFLISQLKRSAASIPLNIAEGHASISKKDYLNHINYAYKSASEVKSTLKLCTELGYITKVKTQVLLDHLDRIKSMLYKLRNRLMEGNIGNRFKYYLRKDFEK